MEMRAPSESELLVLFIIQQNLLKNFPFLFFFKLGFNVEGFVSFLSLFFSNVLFSFHERKNLKQVFLTSYHHHHQSVFFFTSLAPVKKEEKAQEFLPNPKPERREKERGVVLEKERKPRSQSRARRLPNFSVLK